MRATTYLQSMICRLTLECLTANFMVPLIPLLVTNYGGKSFFLSREEKNVAADEAPGKGDGLPEVRSFGSNQAKVSHQDVSPVLE
jgi:hypothetical protein